MKEKEMGAGPLVGGTTPAARGSPPAPDVAVAAAGAVAARS